MSFPPDITVSQKSGMPRFFGQRMIIVGRLVLGENISGTLSRSIEQAKGEVGDIGFILDDLDFSRRIQAYLKSGLKGVCDDYIKQNPEYQGGKFDSSDQAAEKADVDFGRLINEECYQQALAVLALVAPEQLELISSLNWESTHPAMVFLRKRFCVAVADNVLPELADFLLAPFDLDTSNVRFFSEFQLSKIARKGFPGKGRNNSQAGEKVVFLADYLGRKLERSGTKAMAMALYESLSQKGYTRVLHYCDLNEWDEVHEAQSSYRGLREQHTENEQWQLDIECRY